METGPWIRASSDISDFSALFPIEMLSIFFPSQTYNYVCFQLQQILIFVTNINMSKHAALESGNRQTVLAWHLTICLFGNFACFFCCLLIFFKINFFEKFFLEYDHSVTIWFQIRPDTMSGRIWVQTVCKGYQQVTLVCKE